MFSRSDRTCICVFVWRLCVCGVNDCCALDCKPCLRVSLGVLAGFSFHLCDLLAFQRWFAMASPCTLTPICYRKWGFLQYLTFDGLNHPQKDHWCWFVMWCGGNGNLKKKPWENREKDCSLQMLHDPLKMSRCPVYTAMVCVHFNLNITALYKPHSWRLNKVRLLQYCRVWGC